MFYKKTIKNLRDNIANLERKIDNYERKEELFKNMVKMVDEKSSEAIISNIYSYNNSIYAIFFFLLKIFVDTIEIEIYEAMYDKCISKIISEIFFNKDLHIVSIDTEYWYRRQGHASKGLELLIKYAENIGSKRIFGGLLISDDMEYLYKFYSKNGFNVKRTSFEKILNDNANIE